MSSRQHYQERKEGETLEKDSKGKRPDRSARVYKSQYNKPLILNEKDIDSSKPNLKKNIKWKISTPKYMQINLKRNNFMSMSDNFNTGEKGSGKNRDKSSNNTKQGKFCIELGKITTWNKSRGVSADELMEGINMKNIDKQSKTVKASKSKLIKVRDFIIVFTSITYLYYLTYFL